MFLRNFENFQNFALLAAVTILTGGTFAFANLDSSNADFSYKVPTTPSLQPYANFNLKNAQLSTNTGDTSLEFDMPTELTGSDPEDIQHVVLHQTGVDTGGAVAMQGYLGSATCAGGVLAAPTSCMIRYEKKPYSLSALGDLVGRDHFFQRASVLQTFSNDPIGIVTITPR